MIDTHCHLTHPRLAGETEAVLERARQAGVTRCVTIGTGIDDGERARELARRHARLVAATVGLDPFTCHSLGQDFPRGLAALAALLRGGGFVALGEVGLDYHYRLQSPRVQGRQLEQQLDLAVELGLPVVIHVREAHEDMQCVLAAHSAATGVIHSFTAGPVEAERYLALGWSLAFNGVATFPRADDVREAARLVPDDRILLETDSPYLAPVPVRGKRCEPAFVAHTLQRLAQARGQARDELELLTTANAARLFGL